MLYEQFIMHLNNFILYFKIGEQNMSPSLWSSVPETFKNLKKDPFKFRYKNFLLNNYM